MASAEVKMEEILGWDESDEDSGFDWDKEIVEAMMEEAKEKPIGAEETDEEEGEYEEGSDEEDDERDEKRKYVPKVISNEYI